jgi:hypothetical protein
MLGGLVVSRASSSAFALLWVILAAVNASSDNPIIFPDEELILSGGNFHGQPLAMVLDFMAIALAELGLISVLIFFIRGSVQVVDCPSVSSTVVGVTGWKVHFAMMPA